MKPIKQSRLGFTEGNCFAACLASILEVPLEDIDFTANDGWLPICNDKIETFGFRWLEVDLRAAQNYPLLHLYGQVCVFTGKSPRGEGQHSIVGKICEGDDLVEFQILHDPHPDNTGIIGRPYAVGFFIPINPAVSKISLK